MGFKVSIDFRCDGCGKSLRSEVKTRRGRRWTSYQMSSSVYEVSTYAGDLRVVRGPTVYEDEDSSLCCSKACAVKVVTKKIGSLKQSED